MNTDDRRLIDECLAGRVSGRSEAFGELVRRYQDRLYHAVLRMADRAEDAQDVVQDAFLNAYQSLDSFKGDAEFYTWLYRIAFNSAISLRRKKRATVSLDGLGAGRNGHPAADPADQSDGVRPGEAMEKGEDFAAVHAALRRLSDEHRVALVMKDIDGLKYEQIAEVLGVPIGTVRSRLHRARLELRSLLAGYEVHEPAPSHDRVDHAEE